MKIAKLKVGANALELFEVYSHSLKEGKEFLHIKLMSSTAWKYYLSISLQYKIYTE